ncbi:IclR family transcriptional regulator domain-containing protein [Sporosarcina ureae]|uniref:IclR family transcriptional regulator domain-containing protein n=1 Tax=Sporosarcina ureae TaxID=1571 RepID=UPI000A17ECEF|nr:IclR family transcriptional regulator C-terminal domain-containing protein [Sporosarcina ureae]ARK20937.1 IclR family transcriptional regulator [Sporosarcina ureae]
MSSEFSNNLRDSGDFIQSLERGLIVIQAFSEEFPELTVSQAATITGLSRPTVRRLLLTLEALGFAESKNGIFSLTARTLSLGYAYLSSQNLWNLATPFMREFTEKTGESCSISVLEGTDIVYVARVQANRIMRINLNIGSRLPAYATSLGHILLAHLPEDELDERLQTIDFNSFTQNTIVDLESLKQELRNVKQRGWAGVDQQLEEGLRSVAVPIITNGRVTASINCSAHAGRVSKEELRETFLPILQDTSRQISKAFITSLSTTD